MQDLHARAERRTSGAGYPFVELLNKAVAARSDARSRDEVGTQLTLCRALAVQLPAGSLGPTHTLALVRLLLQWLSLGTGTPPTASSGGAADILLSQQQLQCDALKLLLRLAKDSAAQLQPGDARQLLKQLHACCTGAAVTGTAVQCELLCCSADVLAVVPQLVVAGAKQEQLVAAVGIVVQSLEVHTRGGLQEDAPRAVLYLRLLKALQTLLAEAKKDHGCNLGILIPALQRLLSYGLHCTSSPLQPGPSATYPAQLGHVMGAAGARGAAAGAPLELRSARLGPGAASLAHAPPLSLCLDDFPAANAAKPDSAVPAARASNYVPPHLRRASAEGQAVADSTSGPLHSLSTRTAVQQGFSSTAKEPDSIASQGNAACCSPQKAPMPWSPTKPGQYVQHQEARRRSRHSTLDSSDSEVSDSEGPAGGGGGAARASRVRAGVLAVLQILAKSDSKALHASWTSLLPTSEAVLTAHAAPSNATLGYTLLHDPTPKVRQAAAVTITTLLEGPAQRAYLGIAECTDTERQPVRGFITLSMSLGLMAASLHSVLLQSLQSESDAAVVLFTLRALCALLLGSPYHRLPPQLLPRCVQGLQHTLQQAVSWGSPRALPRLPAPLSSETAALAAACLGCMAAAFGTRQPSPALTQHLCPAGCSQGISTSSGSISRLGEPPEAGAAAGGAGAGLVRLLFACASCGNPAVELEAVLALRGLTQQYSGAVQGEWDRVLGLAKSGAAVAAQMVPQSPRSQQDGTLGEKLVHQSIRLVGDFLAATDPSAAGPPSQPHAHSFSLPPSRHGSAALPIPSPPPTPSQSPLPEAPASAVAASAAQPGAQPSGEGSAAQHACQRTALELVGSLMEQNRQRWEAVAQGVLRVAILHGSPLVRAAAHAVIAGLSPETFGTLPPQLQLQLLQWCSSAAVKDDSSPVRAAAAKAVGVLCSSPCCLAVPNGLDMLLAALRSGCRDAVLAVRVQAVPSLAALCRTLASWLNQLAPPATPAPQPAALAVTQACSAEPGAGAAAAQPQPQPQLQPPCTSSHPLLPPGSAELCSSACSPTTYPTLLMPILVVLAAQGAQDSEKVRASGVEALGHAFACLGHSLQHGCIADDLAALSSSQLESAGDALLACLQSSIPKVQWSACNAAGMLLHACSCTWGAQQGPRFGSDPNAAPQHQTTTTTSSSASGGAHLQDQLAWVVWLQQLAHRVVRQLSELLDSCPSMRSRVRAAAALRSMHSMAWFQDAYGELLQPVCRALFAGKACGFQLPASTTHADPGDGTLKLELESQLVLALLHLLALAPSAGSVELGSTPCTPETPLGGTGVPSDKLALLAGEHGVPCGRAAAAVLQPYWTQLGSLLCAALRQAGAGSNGGGPGSEAAPGPGGKRWADLQQLHPAAMDGCSSAGGSATAAFIQLGSGTGGAVCSSSANASAIEGVPLCEIELSNEAVGLAHSAADGFLRLASAPRGQACTGFPSVSGDGTDVDDLASRLSSLCAAGPR